MEACVFFACFLTSSNIDFRLNFLSVYFINVSRRGDAQVTCAKTGVKAWKGAMEEMDETDLTEDAPIYLSTYIVCQYYVWTGAGVWILRLL